MTPIFIGLRHILLSHLLTRETSLIYESLRIRVMAVQLIQRFQILNLCLEGIFCELTF